MNELPDYLEMRESSAERRLDEILQPDGRIKCQCGELFDPGDGITTSPDPYAIPICPKCSEEWMKEMEERNAKSQ